ATVLHALSDRCHDLIDRLQVRLAVQLPDLLRDPLSEVDATTLASILAALPETPGCAERPDAQDLADVCSYAWGSRNLTCCRYALVRASLYALRLPTTRLQDRYLDSLLDLLRMQASSRFQNSGLFRKAMGR
ncbi:tmcA, partial [Symbiodinium pilosum]